MVRLRFSSIRSKALKSFEISSSLMPIPVSLTLNFSQIELSSRCSKSTDKVTVPFSVYLTALVKMFVTTCLILISSPKSTLGIFSLAFVTSCNPFLSARGLIILTKSFKTELSAYSTGIISILPASILLKSKMSFTILSREFPALRKFSAYSKIFLSLDSRKIISSIPKMALIGVLISCDILERKSLLFFAACNAK